MIRRLDEDMQKLREKVFQMGKAVEQSFLESTQAFIERNPSRILKVTEIEETINKFQLAIDDEAVQIISRESPHASDLRLLISILRMNSDLERMGDQAVNITHCVKDYLKQPKLDYETRLAGMALTVKSMITDSLEAFLNNDEELAQKVLLRDDQVDSDRNAATSELLKIMKNDPANVDAALQLLLIARNLERLGDHSTNIAESVIFTKSGHDIRHGGHQTWKAKE